MEEVFALHERPYNTKEPVVGLDEKPVSCHADVRTPRSARPGHVVKRDNEYRRCGTANIFGVVEPKAGRPFTCATPNRAAAAFARIDGFGPREGRRLWRRLTVHSTPLHATPRQLAQPRRDRAQSRLAPMPRHPAHRRVRHPATGDAGVDDPSDTPASHHRLAFHAERRAPHVCLSQATLYTVKDLVAA